MTVNEEREKGSVGYDSADLFVRLLTRWQVRYFSLST